MTADAILQELKQVSSDQPVTLIFTITAGEVTDGNFKKLTEEALAGRSVTMDDLIAINRLNCQIPNLLSGHPERIERHYIMKADCGMHSGTALPSVWEEVLSGDTLPEWILPVWDGKCPLEVHQLFMRDYERNPFREPQVRISRKDAVSTPVVT